MHYKFTTYLMITILQRHGHILSILRHLRYQWPWISLKGHLRSLIFAAIESPCMTSYWTSIVTLVLYCRVCTPKTAFSIPFPYSGKNFRVFPLDVDPWYWGLQRANTPS